MISERRSGMSGVLVLLVGLVTPVVGLVVLLLAVPDNLQSVSPRPAVVTMPVTQTQDAQSQAVQATLTSTAGPTLVAPMWTGLVTTVEVSPGTVVRSGTAIASVNGVERVALASSSPFYRSIGPGTTGPDVEVLRRSLAGLGIGSVGGGGAYDSALGASIKRLEIRLTGEAASAATGVFDPSWVVYLPVPSVTVASIALKVGAMAPGPGQPVLTTPATLDPFTLSPPTSSGAVASSLPTSSAGFVFATAGGTVVPVDAGFSITNPASLAALSMSIGTSTSMLTGQVYLAHPQTFVTVPSTAVVSDAAGKFCVFTFDGQHLTAVVVTPTSGLPGSTEVLGLPSSIQRVVANPGQVASGRACT